MSENVDNGSLSSDENSSSATASSSTSQPMSKEFKAPTFKDDRLILYFHPYNFHSQKVLFLLYEKNIDFVPYALDLANGEQYSSWFLNLNPKGDVPVLQDGAFVIPDSRYIINYVDGKFNGDKNPSLKPRNPNSREYHQVQQYEDILAKLPIGALSMGSFIHEDMKLVPKPPFIGPVRKSCLKNNEKVFDLLKKSIEETTTNKTELQRKLELQEKRKELVFSRETYQKVLDLVQNTLNYMEKELSCNESNEWLVSNDFTIADISFGLLLHRLYQLGFENYYWSYGKMPHVESYFLRFKKRLSYQKIVPSNFEILKDIWQKTPANYKIGAGFLGMAVFTAFAHK